MGLQYEDLDESVRARMVEEIESDGDGLYLAGRLNESGQHMWPDLLVQASLEGSDDTLAGALVDLGLLSAQEMSHRNGVPYVKRVPVNAPGILAEGEFNRFYLRGLCLAAIENGQQIEIYRAKAVSKPRRESQLLVGTILDPAALLADLRAHPGTETALRLPPGAGSGLSGRLV